MLIEGITETVADQNSETRRRFFGDSSRQHSAATLIPALIGKGGVRAGEGGVRAGEMVGDSYNIWRFVWTKIELASDPDDYMKNVESFCHLIH